METLEGERGVLWRQLSELQQIAYQLAANTELSPGEMAEVLDPMLRRFQRTMLDARKTLYQPDTAREGTVMPLDEAPAYVRFRDDP
jgi:hypothetical protein